MLRTKELRDLIRGVQRRRGLLCENGTCNHKYQNEHCPNHDATMWCQDCIARPQLVHERMPDGSISSGYVLGSL